MKLDRESQMLKSWYGNQPKPTRPILKLPAGVSRSQRRLFSENPVTRPGSAPPADSGSASDAATPALNAKPFASK